MSRGTAWCATSQRIARTGSCCYRKSKYGYYMKSTHLKAAGKHAEIAADQIRTISKARLGKRMGALSPADAGRLRRLITEMYGE